MQFDVTPCSAPSSATTLDRPSSPCLAATYAALNGDARRPCTDEMFTILPQPLAYMCGRACRTSRNGASSMTRIITENRSGEKSSTLATCCRPALLTRMSHSIPSASTASRSDRSSTTARPPTWAATRSAPSRSRSTTTTSAPAAASRTAHAAPMPLAAPMTTAVRPARSGDQGDMHRTLGNQRAGRHMCRPHIRPRRGVESDRVRGHDRRVVAPALGVRRGAMHFAGRGRGGEVGGGDLVVDPPAGVVVERLAAPRPPRVRPGPVAAVRPADVDPAGREQPVHPGPLAGQEAALLLVRLPRLQVDLAVCDVQVAAPQHVPPVGAQLGEPGGDRVQERVLLLLPRRRLRLPGVHVHADRGQRRTVVEHDIGLDPAAAAGEPLRADLRSLGLDRPPGRDHNTRPTLVAVDSR